MTYDKTNADGTVVEAPKFTYRVLDGVPLVFQVAEWLLVIVAFQYADERFHFLAAKITWIALTVALAVYVGAFGSNLLWRSVADPYNSPKWRHFSRIGLPVLSGAAVYGLQQLVKQMVLAQQG
jgi:hypothetical protein